METRDERIYSEYCRVGNKIKTLTKKARKELNSHLHRSQERILTRSGNLYILSSRKEQGFQNFVQTLMTPGHH